jgi:phage tail-like protein
MATGSRKDSLAGYHWHLEFDGVTDATFREVNGLGSEQQVIESKEAGKGGKTIIRKIPGALKWSDITLKRGITDNMTLWKWRKDVEDGNVDKARKDGSIVLYDQADKEIARWNFEAAWPSKITGPSLNANGNDIAVEELVICHEGLKREK